MFTKQAIIDTLPVARKVEKYGRLYDEMKAIQTQLDELKKEFKSYGGEVILASKDTEVSIKERSRKSLDKNAVIEMLGEQWVEENSNETIYLEVSAPKRRKVNTKTA